MYEFHAFSDRFGSVCVVERNGESLFVADPVKRCRAELVLVEKFVSRIGVLFV